MDDDIVYRFEESAWLTGEVTYLDEDIFLFFGIEISPIYISQEREVFIESFPVIFFEIDIEYFTSFFYKKCALLSIYKLPYMITCFLRLYK
jgi:hypothetical protein